jgi:hypothetical protein
VLSVAEDGSGIVRVTSGWVEFELNYRERMIPAGAAAYTDRQRGPGTPFYEDSSPEFKAALRELDFAKLDPDQRKLRLATILRQARPRDVYTLLSLMHDATAEELGQIFDRAASLSRPPAGVTRDGIVHRNSRMVDEWMHSLGLGNAKRWWVNWKDAL